jgi:hypothetical protein
VAAKLIALFFWAAVPAQAVEETCHARLKEIALELVELELAGNRASAKTPCLDEKNFRWIKPYHDEGGENPHQPAYWIAPGVRPTVQKIAPVAGQKNIYEFTFSVKTKEGKTITDRIRFDLNASAPSSSRDCANLLFPPQVSFRRVACVPQ